LLQFSTGQPESDLIDQDEEGRHMPTGRLVHAFANVLNVLKGRACRIELLARETDTQEHGVLIA